jgi:phosphotriesterase-related protein
MRAVAQASQETGAAVTVHTHADTRSGHVTQRVSAEEGVDLAKVIIGHSRDTDGVDDIFISHDSSCLSDFFDPADRNRLVPNWNCRHISNDVLLEAGLDEANIESVLVQNPERYFTV